MGMKISTALAKSMLDTGSFRDSLAGMKLNIYQGTEPATADASIGSAVLLVTISDSGGADPLEFEAAAVGNTIEKSSSQVWNGVVATSGTAQFCRLVLPSDTGATSTTEVRVQGDVGLAGKFCNISSTSLTASATQDVDYLAISIPLQ